jgi:hypothetical protein
MKSQEQLNSIGKVIKRKYNINFYAPDFRKKGGTQKQQEFAKEMKMYRQDYCGCIYGIWQQKRHQEIIDELFSPITKQVLPSSIEEKLLIYTKRLDYEEKGIEYKILKENFLNYRLLQGVVKANKEVVDSYILFYSYLERGVRGRVEYIKDGVGYFNRMQIIFVTLKKFNAVLNKTYKNVKDVFFSPLGVDEEILFREKITHTKYSLSPIIVVDEIDNRYEVDIKAKVYPDVREILIKL